MDVYESLRAALPEAELIKNAPMREYTTMRAGGPADALLEVRSEGELAVALTFARANGIGVYVIGNGSNLLVSDDGVRGLVARVAGGMAQITVEGCILEAGAGAQLSRLAAAAHDAGLVGLEFAAGIPGTVGGAVYMNAGAYGGQISDFFESARVLTEDGANIELSCADMRFAYRHSALQESGDIVLSARFRLERGDVAAAKARAAELAAKRRQSQPLDKPSAGSAFKRPSGEGLYAAALIDSAGLKGFRIGDAAVSDKHAGFIVNMGSATATDIYRLIHEVKARVLAASGVELEPEVRLIGRFPEAMADR